MGAAQIVSERIASGGLGDLSEAKSVNSSAGNEHEVH